MAAVLSYADKNYKRQKALYDVLAQVFQEWKYGAVHTNNKWNLPVEQISGMTMRLLGEGHLELTYHHYEVTTVEGLARAELEGKKFVEEVVKILKKEFKKITGEALDLKKVKDGQVIDKVSRIQADSSWMLGSSRYGYGNRPVGRYLVRDSCVYSFDVGGLFGGPNPLDIK